ncbi:SDR family NAD(P)-dependent oxidoreductase [Blastococcus saxobsidens]|uniref:Short-chain dehydrogenase/reductase SDR n=1 Tax=Blastococcus saxobsidens (strain DD2) TaxID=1146883 RepID=H6RN34_BLASD|nr:SDR family oxidoreductase [Blastococcus saxobsidens]CCG01387.1 Short-chain dehydrogenase/reductase SDR [Blastococcus saxobsidens DD2]
MSDLVVITGTSGGLGRALAREAVANGYRVLGIARRSVEEADIGDGYAHLCADLSDIDAIPRLARQVLAEHGAPYGLVNNAAAGLDGLLPTMHNSQIRAVLDLDLLSPIMLTKYLCRPMLSVGRGRVITVSSIVARTGFRGLSVYAAAKAGLEGFTRSLARDLGRRGVTVNAVAPGFLDTDMTTVLGDAGMARVQRRSPLDRFATTEEVAAAVTYLLSPAAAGVTGTTLTVDAGSTA